MLTPTNRWVAAAFWLACAALSQADEVSLVGDYRLTKPGQQGHVQIDDQLQARILIGGEEQTAKVEVESGGATAVLRIPGAAPLRLAARPEGGFDVIGGGRLQRQKTFTAGAIERTKAFLVANAASSSNLDCITTVNRAVRLLNSDGTIRVGSQQDRTMNGLVAQGLAESPRVIDFYNEQGKPTTGVTQPHKLRESAFQALRTMAKGDRGWSVFGLSLMDGYHSVLLFLDTNDPANPRVYWADQWSSKGGFKEYTGEGLDEEIEAKTRSWWSSSSKPRSRTTLWRLKPQAKGQVQIGTVRVSQLNVRQGPSGDEDKVDSLRGGAKVQVTDTDGVWRQVRTPAGATGWAHSAYLAPQLGVPSGQGLRVSSGGITAMIGS